MIARPHRFHGHASLKYLFASGQTVRAGSLSLRFSPNPHRQTYRVAVVVSRKVSKSAVVRNRIRRRLYEHVRILSASFTKPYDLMLVAYDEQLAELPPRQLQAQVSKLLTRAGILPSLPPKHGIVDQKN